MSPVEVRLPRVPSAPHVSHPHSLHHSHPSHALQHSQPQPHTPMATPSQMTSTAHAQPHPHPHPHTHKHSLSLNALHTIPLPSPQSPATSHSPALRPAALDDAPGKPPITSAMSSALASPGTRRRAKGRSAGPATTLGPAPGVAAAVGARAPTPGSGASTPLNRPSTPLPPRPTHSRTGSLDPRPKPAPPTTFPAAAPGAPYRTRPSSMPAEPASFPSWDSPHLPLAFALLPVVTSVLFGRGEVVADLFFVLLLWWYLSFLTHSPWELYTSSLRHASPAHTQHLLLLLTLAAPLLGGSLLALISRSLTFLPPLPSFSIRLFVLAASIRPVKHLLALWQGAVDLPTLHDAQQDEVLTHLTARDAAQEHALQAQSREMAQLREQLDRLAQEVLRARAETAVLAKAVKRQERKAELYRLGVLHAKPAAGAGGTDLAASDLQEKEGRELGLEQGQAQGGKMKSPSEPWTLNKLMHTILAAPAWAWAWLTWTREGLIALAWSVLWRAPFLS
ncbi:hypothetical protein CALCODRAFT_257395 [Calocera cornea HHB12733]|uniref:Uncharacterized protein n=1 Tax=Calocera cornea HHB12733 TaxID=1353952 RepID=A0A165GKM2_9BASI|nr:hypothetical protein CALCODRAFT_257395 [Calocera cornea HHB12733]